MELTVGVITSAVLLVSFILRFGGRPARQSRLHNAGPNLTRLAVTYVEGHVAVVREREHRETLLATMNAMPPGATLVDRRADGAMLTIQTAPAPGDRRTIVRPGMVWNQEAGT
jgi:hypothetical protein